MAPGEESGEKNLRFPRRRPFRSIVAAIAASWLLFSPHIARAEGPAPAPLPAAWNWSQPTTSIHNTSFSPDGRSVLLELRVIVPTELLLDKKKLERETRALRSKDPRFADPTIAIVQIGAGSRETLGYGWDPAFSPDGTRVVFEELQGHFLNFSAEKQPEEEHGIALVDVRSRQQRRVAEARGAHCIRPIFAPDGRSVVFGVTTPEAAFRFNDPVSLERVDLESGARTVLHAQRESLGEPNYLRRFEYVGNRLLARRSIAARRGQITVAVWLEQLVDVGANAVVYSWGEQDAFGAASIAFGRWRDGTPAVYVRSWSSVASNPRPHVVIGLRDMPENGGALSPDGKLVARSDDEGTVTVRDLATGKLIGSWERTAQTSGTAPEDLAWSADSRRLAWIDQGVEAPRGSDVLVVVTLPAD